ncbi:unnamed protein product, partial [Pylaiella littoralis]
MPPTTGTAVTSLFAAGEQVCFDFFFSSPGFTRSRAHCQGLCLRISSNLSWLASRHDCQAVYRRTSNSERFSIFFHVKKKYLLACLTIITLIPDFRCQSKLSQRRGGQNMSAWKAAHTSIRGSSFLSSKDC